jgi:hypothetical protein
VILSKQQDNLSLDEIKTQMKETLKPVWRTYILWFNPTIFDYTFRPTIFMRKVSF